MINTVLITHAVAAAGGGAVIYVLMRHVAGMLTTWEAGMAADVAHLKALVTGSPKAAPVVQGASAPLPATVHAQ